MANEEQLAILKQGVEIWNKWKWREENLIVRTDFSEAQLSRVDLREAQLMGADLRRAVLLGTDLTGADLTGADLTGAILREAKLRSAILWATEFRRTNLIGADLTGADLRMADLVDADFRDAKLMGAILWGADLRDADLRDADLRDADLRRVVFSNANLIGADLSRANLNEAQFVGTKVNQAKISRSSVYGINVWDLVGEFKEQNQLIVTPHGTSVVTVDNIKVAQFIYLVLNNQEIRDVLNTLTAKSVLILGRFALAERKEILDALRIKLREYDLLPIVFDFERPTDKDFTETIKTLAGLCLFVIADVTNPKSSPLELQATVPDYQIPFVPIIQEGEEPFAMMKDLHTKYNWVLEPRSYGSIETLMKALKPGIIDPAMKMHAELRLIKAKEQVIHPLQDFLDKD
jgi:uncharacterized protein YjbI with pentapeptide repeats